jgi:hypothetical protein
LNSDKYFLLPFVVHLHQEHRKSQCSKRKRKRRNQKARYHLSELSAFGMRRTFHRLFDSFLAFSYFAALSSAF